MLCDVNKLFVFQILLATPNNVLPLHLKQTFPPIFQILTEGEGDRRGSRLPFIFSTLFIWVKGLFLSSMNLKHMVTTSDLHQWILGSLVYVWWILDQHQTRIFGGGFRFTDFWNWRFFGTFSGILLLINCPMDYLSIQKLLQ